MAQHDGPGGHGGDDLVARALKDPEWLKSRYGAREGTDNGRESMEVDVLFVGAGPANLAAALRLHQLATEHDAAVDAGRRTGRKLGELNIAIVEKASEVGRHSLSGAVIDPRAMDELLPGWESMEAPVEGTCTFDALLFLTPKSAFRAPMTPPNFENHGNRIVSLSRFTKWMAGLCEQKGINIFPGFPAVDVLWDGDRVAGVRTGDKGLDAHGGHKANYEPGINLVAKLTVFGEGVLGPCTRIVDHWLGLSKGRNPQVYETGVKEVLELPAGRVPGGRVYHFLGWPLDMQTLGGGFMYDMGENRISLGLVVSLDYKDPGMDLHYQFQRLKSHPWVAEQIEGAKVVSYGAKGITSGGWYSRPRPYFDGGMLVGESAGLLDIQKLKGVHLAIKSGILAAETAFVALLKGDTSAAALKPYDDGIEGSYIKTELWAARNFHQGFQQGVLLGSIRAGLSMFFGAGDRKESHPDHSRTEKLRERYPEAGKYPEQPKLDIPTWNDKLTDIYISGTVHEEHQPPHLRVADTEICSTVCAEEFGNPCTRFCPASVYEMVEKNGRRELQLNFTNCVHCKTCDIKDPYQIITWVPPEGGGGPGYTIN